MYAVYAAVLTTGWPKPDLPRTDIALQDKTMAHALCDGWQPSLAPEWQPALRDYATRNAEPRRLRQGSDLGVPYTLVTSEKYEDLIMIAAGDADKVYADFRGGVNLALSAVGFDSAKTHAMATLQYSCSDSGCAHGRVFLLERQNGRWAAATTGIPDCAW